MLDGRYRIVPTAKGVAARRLSGEPLGDREKEQLNDLAAGEFAPPLFAKQLRSLSLRVGETVEMSAADKDMVWGGVPIPAPVFVTLVRATADALHYQIDVLWVAKQGILDEVRLRIDVTLDPRTGWMIALEDHTLKRSNDGHLERSHSKSVTTYTRR